MNMPATVYEMEILLHAALAGRVVANSNDEVASLARLIGKGLVNQNGGVAYLTDAGLAAANSLRTGS